MICAQHSAWNTEVRDDLLDYATEAFQLNPTFLSTAVTVVSTDCQRAGT